MPRARRLDSLTEREQAVLALIRRGLTNEEIAASLDITVAGAKYHVSQILDKLGVASREEAAAWQPREHRRSWWRSIVALSLGAKIGGVTILAATAIGIGVLAWGVAQTGSGAGPSPGSAVSIIPQYDQQLRDFGFAFKQPDGNYVPAVSQDAAQKTADGAYGGGKVDHLVLAQMTNGNDYPTADQIVWVAVFDPQTIIVPNSSPPSHPNYALMFISAATGGFISGFMH